MRILRRGRRRLALAAGFAAVGGAAWSLFESQWVERNELEVTVPSLPPALDRFRILHLSDLHLGTLSLGGLALDRAVAWARQVRPDLIAITGDLVTRRGGKWKLEQALAELDAPWGVYAVLGNHDVDDARDPFTRPTDLSDLQAAGAVLLRDDARTVERDGSLVQVVGVDPASYRARTSRPLERVDERAALRILLCHFPEVVRGLPGGAFHLVLAGHYHGGQITLPTPWGRIHLKELRSDFHQGLFETPAGALHVSRGLGTALIPFRFFARPEATLLTLRASN